MSGLGDEMVAAASREFRSDGPEAAIAAALRILVDHHFMDDDVDYHYACEGLAGDAIDVLNSLSERASAPGGSGPGRRDSASPRVAPPVLEGGV